MWPKCGHVQCSDLKGEDLDSDVFAEQLSLPHAAKAPPGFRFQQLQRLVTQDWGGGQGARLLKRRKGERRQENTKTETLVRAIRPCPHGQVLKQTNHEWAWPKGGSRLTC